MTIKQDFKKGDRVKCINDTVTLTLHALKKNEIYTVRELFIRKNTNTHQLFLEEIFNKQGSDGVEMGYRAARFIKVDGIENTYEIF